MIHSKKNFTSRDDTPFCMIHSKNNFISHIFAGAIQSFLLTYLLRHRQTEIEIETEAETETTTKVDRDRNRDRQIHAQRVKN